MRLGCVFVSLVLLVGCGESSSSGGPGDRPSRARIGPGGGSIASADGGLRLEVPAGALTEEVELAIEPLSGQAPHGVGAAYRLLPEGQTFLVPVELSFSFGSGVQSPGGLGVAFRSAGSDWRVLRGRTVDAGARRVTAATTHFSDWSLIEMLKLDPSSARVDEGRAVELEVLVCFEVGEGEEPSPLLPLCVTLDEPSYLGGWSVNGTPGGSAAVGTVAGSGSRATYTAPSSAPRNNPVAVSVDVRLSGTAAGLLVSHIDVGPSDCPLGVCTLTGTTTYFTVIHDSPEPRFTTTDVANLTFTYDHTTAAGHAIYRPSGSISARWDLEGCTITLSPATHEIGPGDGELVLDLRARVPTFSGGKQVFWDGIQTWVCPPAPGHEHEEIFAGWTIGRSELVDGVLAGRTDDESGGYAEWQFFAVE